MAGEYYVSKKYHEISVLAEEITKQISKNGEEWAKYLTTAAKLYKYPFEEQMLIYAQRPDATACATMETWNEKMSCWVNRGAKGIALFDRKSERPKLKYVFDVSDVHKARYIGKKPYLWEMGEEHKDVVLAQLEKTYGATDKNKSFENRLIEIAIRIAEDYYMEILPDLAYAKEGSFLEELDGLNIGVRLRDTLSSSIAYTLLSRCGADMDYWKEDLDFGYINEFNTTKTLSVIGNATANICKPLLMEIGRTVAAYDRQTARNKAKEKVNGIQTEQQSVQIPEKNAEIRKDENLSQISLANQSELRYNALKHKSDLHTKMDIPIYVAEEQSNKNKETEGSSYEPDIREERGLPDPQLDAKQRTGGSTDPIRADAQEVSGRTSQGDLQRDASGGQPESTLSGDTEPSRVENGCADGADGESRGSGRGTESVRPDAVGGNDEQYPTLGRGNRINGVGLPPLTSKGQQNIEMEKPDNDHKDGENSLSGSFLDNLQLAHDRMEIQKGILCFDQFLIHKRPEIAGYFAMEQDTDLQTEYLKNSFRMEEYTEFYLGENGRIRAGYYADEDGLTVWKGSYFHREAEARISWEDARYWVNSYIEDGVYLLPGEKAEQIDTSGMYRQLDLFSMFTEQVGSIAMKQAEQEIIPEKKEILPSKTAIPKEQLETILRSGGGRENSRKRIYAKYQQGKTSEEMTEFLKKEYGTTGKPLVIKKGIFRAEEKGSRRPMSFPGLLPL